MGSSNYEISIYNKMEGVISAFYLFQCIEGGHRIDSTYVVRAAPRTEGARDGSTMITFNMVRKFYAVCGSAHGGPHDGVTVRTTIWKPAELGPGGSVFAVTVKDDNRPAWNEDAARGKISQQPGSFQILTDASFTGPELEHIFIGVGTPDAYDEDRVTLIETWGTEPNRTTTIFPKVTYYIAKGDLKPGDTIDVVNMGRHVKIDFDGATSTAAYLAFNPDGTYTDYKNYCADHGIKLSMEG